MSVEQRIHLHQPVEKSCSLTGLDRVALRHQLPLLRDALLSEVHNVHAANVPYQAAWFERLQSFCGYMIAGVYSWLQLWRGILKLRVLIAQNV